MSTTLHAVPDNGYTDLPVEWDGLTLEWSAWETRWTTAEWHLPKEPCEVCGCTDVRPISHATVIPKLGETFTAHREKTLPSGRVRQVPYQTPAWPVMRFIAFRCPQCGLDEVWDSQRQEMWTLDASDYGPKGSVL